MTLKFTKMHGAGNDFVVIDAINQTINLSSEQIRCIADRHSGVGCDQVLLVERSIRADADFRYRIFNADGGEVEQCGNGARCFMRFVHHYGLTNQREIRVETASGVIAPRLEDDGRVAVNLGPPIFNPAQVPFLTDQQADTYPLYIGEQVYAISVVSMGNPHAVLDVVDVESAPVGAVGAAMMCHPQFPHRVNVGFMQYMDAHHIKLRVFERGTGETLSCGSGACAAVVTGVQRKRLLSPVDVTTRGGVLTIAWSGQAGDPVWLTGPTVIVFEGDMAQGMLE